jgi:hypothetical protein
VDTTNTEGQQRSRVHRASLACQHRVGAGKHPVGHHMMSSTDTSHSLSSNRLRDWARSARILLVANSTSMAGPKAATVPVVVSVGGVLHDLQHTTLYACRPGGAFSNRLISRRVETIGYKSACEVGHGSTRLAPKCGHHRPDTTAISHVGLATFARLTHGLTGAKEPVFSPSDMRREGLLEHAWSAGVCAESHRGSERCANNTNFHRLRHAYAVVAAKDSVVGRECV